MARFCTNCGATLDDDKKFCTECGTSMADAPTREAEPAADAVGASSVNIPPPPRQVSQPQQPIYQAQTPPTYAPQPAYNGDAPPPSGSKYEPITAGGYIGIMLLMCIPVVGLILAIVWACGGCRKINKRNLARATLIMMVIGLIVSLVVGFAAKSLINKAVEAIEQETGVSITGEQNGESGGLGGLLGLIGGSSGDSAGTNESLDALKELEDLLGDLGQDNGELSDTIDAIGDINAEAEAKNSGWPKSLRAYPGGTATATASYRTEITDTTLEEMLAWIDDLKGDGFAYQDFYDFGMTEEDMLSVNGWWATDGDIYLSISFDGEKVIIDHMNELPDMSSLLGG